MIALPVEGWHENGAGEDSIKYSHRLHAYGGPDSTNNTVGDAQRPQRGMCYHLPNVAMSGTEHGQPTTTTGGAKHARRTGGLQASTMRDGDERRARTEYGVEASNCRRAAITRCS